MNRQAIADVLTAQQERRNAPAEARAAARTLADPRTVAIVTGQQAGLFGGPLTRCSRRSRRSGWPSTCAASTACRWSRCSGSTPKITTGTRSRPARCSTATDAPRQSTAAPPGRRRATRRGRSATPTTSSRRRSTSSSAALPPTEFTPALIGRLARRLRAGRGMADAFGRWLERCSATSAWSSSTRRIRRPSRWSADLFARELEQPGATATLAARPAPTWSRAAITRRSRRTTTALALFHLDGGAPCRSRRQADEFVVGRSDSSRRAARRSARPSQPPRRSARTCCCGRSCRTRSSRRSVTWPDRTSCLPRPAARRLRALRRADAADVSARHGDARRLGGAAVPDANTRCRSKRCRRRTSAR